MLTQYRISILVAVAVGLFAEANATAQTNTSTASILNATGRGEGLTLNVTRPIAVKPKVLRVVFPFKAEDATTDKAIEKISSHMEAIQDALTDLGAVESSIEFAALETNPSSASPYVNTGAGQQMAWAVNAAFPNAFQAVQIAPAVPIQARQAMPAARLTPAVPGGEQAKALPTFVIATSAVSADWNIEEKSTTEIAAMKPKLLAAIIKQNLDGKELIHKFTSEQEDEIFEITKIDIRNGDTRNMFSSSVPAPRAFFVGSIAESDNAEALKAAFQTVEKMASQMAQAGSFQLGRMDTASVALSSRYSLSAVGNPSPYNPYLGTTSYPQSSQLSDWEPLIPTGDIRMDSLNQLKQNLTLTVRYRFE